MTSLSVSLALLKDFVAGVLGSGRAKLRHVTVNVRPHLWNLSNKANVQNHLSDMLESLYAEDTGVRNINLKSKGNEPKRQ